MSFIQESREIVDNINGNCDLGRLMADEIVFGSSCDTAYDGAILICRAYFEFIDTEDKDAFEKKLESVKEKYNYGDNIDTARKYFDKVFEKKLEEMNNEIKKLVDGEELKVESEDDDEEPKVAEKVDSEAKDNKVGDNEVSDNEVSDNEAKEIKKKAKKAKEIKKKAKKAKADKPKCGGKKKNGDACGFNAGENGFCKRHSDTEEAVKPRAKKVAAKAVKVQQWGKWENIESDFEEDSDFEYEYEEIWV
jgi:hypothetical protein